MLKVCNLGYEVIENGKKVTIVKDISFTVEDGEMLVITGPNGGGKSTVAKLLMGILPATEGQILLDGEDIMDLSVNERANAGIGYAFQQPPAFKGMTVRRLLNLAAGKELPEHICCDLLSSVGMCAGEYLDREVDATLSGGERKRVEIATVLAKSHKVCIFDEPEAGIDLWSFSMLVDEFEKIHRDKKETLLLISHQEKIIQMADRILVIRDGSVEKCGEAEEILPMLFGGVKECACVNRRGGSGYGIGCGNK
jgi:Fe-S cluster assembly ATP-binding protein